SDIDFATLYKACESGAFHKYYRHDGFLFWEHRLCIPRSSTRELLVREAHNGGLMGHFGVHKTLGVLQEHFYWPHMRKDVQHVCTRCINCLKAKSTSKPHG
ncbi:hypothetical protein JJ728_23345, partial [Salmonella enterica subsp. enterica serovar Typhi]|nr:hypothetical protein [Salmonella enterica subsp. enterica serovar Typhi]